MILPVHQMCQHQQSHTHYTTVWTLIILIRIIKPNFHHELKSNSSILISKTGKPLHLQKWKTLNIKHIQGPQRESLVNRSLHMIVMQMYIPRRVPFLYSNIMCLPTALMQQPLISFPCSVVHISCIVIL